MPPPSPPPTVDTLCTCVTLPPPSNNRQPTHQSDTVPSSSSFPPPPPPPSPHPESEQSICPLLKSTHVILHTPAKPPSHTETKGAFISKQTPEVRPVICRSTDSASKFIVTV